MAVANLHIYDDNYKLEIIFIVFCDIDNTELDTKSTLIEYSYPKLQWKIEVSVMAVANLHFHDENDKLEIIMFIVFCHYENIRLDTILIFKVTVKLEFSVMVVANLTCSWW